MLLRPCVFRTVVAGGLLATIGGVPMPVFAQDATAWSGDERSAVRLLAGERRNENGGPILRAGIEIKLAPGWKTYWRYPGDSGVPPRPDFSGSVNVRAVDVLWPAPERFSDADGNSIGYKSDVILPLHIVPEDASRPATLRLKLEYAICEKLCVPADATARLSVSGARTPYDAILAAAEERVPKSVPAVSDAHASGSLGIRAVREEDAMPHPRIVVDVTAPAGDSVDLLAEGPTPDWALPLPQEAPGAPPGIHRFVFDLDGAPPDTKAEGAALRLTVIDGNRAIETVARPESAHSD